jgi:hypothetical protein
MFLSLWVLENVLCVFVSMSSEGCFVCFCLYGFWGLFCMFLSIWDLRIALYVFFSMGSGDCFVCFCLYEFWGFFCVFLSLWVLRIVLYVFVYMSSKTYKTILRTYRDKNTQNNPQDSYRQKHTNQSSELI